MKIVVRCSAIVLALFALFFPARSLSQINPIGFSSGAGGFYLAVPATPTERKAANLTLGSFYLDGESITWRDAAGNSTFAEHYYIERDKPNLTAAQKTAIVSDYKRR
jgi:hypothetical protein